MNRQPAIVKNRCHAAPGPERAIGAIFFRQGKAAMSANAFIRAGEGGAKGICEVGAQPGECATVASALISFHDTKMGSIVESGDFELMTGNRSWDADRTKLAPRVTQ